MYIFLCVFLIFFWPMGLLNYLTFDDKLLLVFLFHEDITQLDQNNPALGVHI